jgi:general stress protein 26
MYDSKPLPHMNDDNHILPKKRERMHAFLEKIPVGVLSSVSPDNTPHGAVVYFSVSKEFVISILTKRQTKKYDNLKHNNHVMLTVYEPLSQTTLQVTGLAEEVIDAVEINNIAETNLAASLKTSESGIPAIMKLDAGEYVAFAIRPVEIRMASYIKPDSGAASELFEIVENFSQR